MKLKKPITYEEQIAKLLSYGFEVEDKEQLTEFLKQANYYRLSAYLLPFKNSDKSFIQGIPMLRIRSLYDFDAELRNWALSIIEVTEHYLKTQLAYYIAHKYGASSYLNENIFNSYHKHDRFLNKIKKCIHDNSKTLVVQHHNEKYNGVFPIWVIVEFFSIGMLSFFYADLKSEDQKIIAQNSFNTGHSQLVSWLRTFAELRNKCAHFTRLYFWQFTSVPRNITLPGQEEIWTMDRSLFSQIYMLKYLHPNFRQWQSESMPRLEAIIKKYESYISFDHIGFPENWIELLTEG